MYDGKRNIPILWVGCSTFCTPISHVSGIIAGVCHTGTCRGQESIIDGQGDFVLRKSMKNVQQEVFLSPPTGHVGSPLSAL